MTWIAAVPAGVVLLGLLYLPGYLVLRALGTARLQAVGAAPAASMCGLGVLACAYHGVGVRWAPVSVGVGITVLTVACLTVTAFVRRNSAPWCLAGPPPWWPVGAAIAVAACLSGAAVIHGIGPADGVATAMQASDGVWHLNAAAYVRAGGDAYPSGALAPMYWGERHFYPVAWHSVVAIVPAPVVVAANLMVVVGLALAWPLGCASVVGALFPAGGRRVRDALPWLVGTIASSWATAPFVVMTMVWPYALSVCLLPGVVGLLLVARPAPNTARRRTAASRGAGVVAAVIAALGLVYLHGTALFNLLVLGAPGVLAASWRLTRAWWRAGGRPRRVLVAGTLALVGGLAGGAWVMRAPLLMLATYHRPAAPRRDVVWEALRDATMVNRLPDIGLGAVALSVLALVGVVSAWRRHRHRWAVLAAALASMLLLASVHTDSLTGLLSTPWYMQKSRILPLLEIPVLVLACVTVEAAVMAADGWWPRRGLADGAPGRGVPAVLTAVAAVVSLGVMVAVPVIRQAEHTKVVAWAYQPSELRWPVMLSPGEQDFIERSARMLPPGSVIAADPTNGSAYYWALTGQETGTDVLYPTLRANQDADLLYVARHAAQIFADPEVCRILNERGAHYLYLDRDREGGSAPGEGAKAQWANNFRFTPQGALELVTTDGTHSLWRIRACD